ncbi:MAG: hypothetical protein WBA51_07360 [Erythrobacter sp.]
MITASFAALLLSTGATSERPEEVAVDMPTRTDGAADSILGGAEYTKLPETWELVYDIAMKPYIDDYKRCLGYGNLMFNGTANVERQHRARLSSCADLRAEAIALSNAALSRRGRTGEMPPADVEKAFDTLGYIHIQRGRNLDQQFQLHVRAMEERQRRYAEQVAARDGALQAEQYQSLDIPNAQN